jgi:hypothetical protein
LKSYILNNSGIKEILGTALSSRMYIEMLKAYVTAINSGGVPNIRNAWEVIMENECLQSYKKVNLYYSNVIYSV